MKFVRFRIQFGNYGIVNYYLDEISRSFFGKYSYNYVRQYDYTGNYDPEYLTLKHGKRIKKSLPENVRLFGIIDSMNELEIL